MNRHRFVSLLTLLFVTVATACVPKSTPAPVAPVAAPTATPAPGPAEAPPAAAPVVGARAIPSMDVGSTFRYFDGSLLVPVAAGPFTMGNGAQDAPIRTVSLSDFWIYSTEVTNRMYALCVKLGQCSPPDAKDNPIFDDLREGNKPVVGINWQQADDYCNFAAARLPTEAEWEKTARGPNGNMYPWGNDPPKCDWLNFDGCVRKTTFVGIYSDGESHYKAMDMSGNVFEWVADWYLADYYHAAPTQNPAGAVSGTKRSVRSSAFNTDGFLTEAARRFFAEPDDHRADLGFRCVVEDPAYFAPFCTQLLVYGKNAPGGSGGGKSLNEECSQPVLDQELLNCTQTNVWVDDDGGGISSSTGLDTCIDGGMQMHNGELQHLYTCSGAIRPIDACGTCEYPLPSGGASCPDGYHQAGQQCVIDQGSTGQCPEGSTYDPTLMCCSVTTGLGNLYDLCPPPYSYVPGGAPDEPGSCVEYVAGGIKCAPDVLHFKEGCGGHQPNCEEHPDDPACQPCDPSKDPNCRPGGCPPNYPNCNPATGACLAANTFIETPAGPVAVDDLRVGDAVWTADSAGRRVSATILRTSRVTVPSTHEMVHLLMADGSQLWVSPQHPTADGRTVGDLVAGDSLGGVRVTQADRVPYDQPATFDLLPSGETGYYWANGVLLGSTLATR